MKTRKFKIGDRVRQIAPQDGVRFSGEGTVRKFDTGHFYDVGVEWDYSDSGYGHDLDGKAVSGRGWYHKNETLELVTNDRAGFIVVQQNIAGVLFPASSPLQHSTEEAALKEAERLANTVGGRFVVFGPIAHADKPKIEVVRY